MSKSHREGKHLRSVTGTAATHVNVLAAWWHLAAYSSHFFPILIRLDSRLRLGNALVCWALFAILYLLVIAFQSLVFDKLLIA